MLSIDGLHAAYGKVSALESVSLKVEPGQIVCLLGANGAGKTTTLNCVSGLVAATSGRIVFEGEDIGNLRVEDVVSRGVVQVPEGRAIFTAMSVEDNLTLGAWRFKNWRHGSKQRNRDELERVYTLFPRLRERATQFAGTLSGGEQQMLMIGRALMAKPKSCSCSMSRVLGFRRSWCNRYLTSSRPSIGAASPSCWWSRMRASHSVSAYADILENGEINLQGPAAELAQNSQVHEAYLGGGSVIRH